MNEEIKVLDPSLGTTLKIHVDAGLGNNLTLDDVDFNCKFFTNYNNKGMTIAKGDAKMLPLGDGTYLAIVPTREVGTGVYMMRLTAFLPDTDVEGGFREEVVTISTGIPVK